MSTINTPQPYDSTVSPNRTRSNQLDNSDRLIDYKVNDKNNEEIGTVSELWDDHSGQPSFLTVKTGWFGLGKTVVVPVYTAQVNDVKKTIRLPFTSEQVKNAPHFESEYDLNEVNEGHLYDYYSGFGYQRPASLMTPPPLSEAIALPAPTSVPPVSNSTVVDHQSLELKKENLVVGKRDLPEGGLRLKKIVRSENVSQSVDLLRENAVVDRTSVDRIVTGPTDFVEEEIYIPLRREEAVVGKQVVVSEEIVVRKEAGTQVQNVEEVLRHEEVEITDTTKNIEKPVYADRS